MTNDINYADDFTHQNINNNNNMNIERNEIRET